MVHFWKNTERANRRFWEKNLSQYYFVQHKSHTSWFGMESEIETGDEPSELWSRIRFIYTIFRSSFHTSQKHTAFTSQI